jgi:hypothetical protein
MPLKIFSERRRNKIPENKISRDENDIPGYRTSNKIYSVQF